MPAPNHWEQSRKVTEHNVVTLRDGDGRMALARPWLRLVVENNVEQRAVDLQTAVVMNEPQFPEPVHEKAHSRTRGADHFCQGLLANSGNIPVVTSSDEKYLYCLARRPVRERGSRQVAAYGAQEAEK